MEIKKVAVIGSGVMGRQIAMQIAISGYEVVCYSNCEDSILQAKEFSKNWFRKNIDKGKMTENVSNEIQNRLIFTTELQVAVTNSDLVIEAVVELVDIKRSVLEEIDALTPAHTIFASNSSYIVSSEFAHVVKNPGKVLNLHFFVPALVMKLVEIVKGPHVSDETIEVMMEFTKSIGKEPVLVHKEIYGFIVNRIFSAITQEACYLFEQDIAGIEDIDRAIKLGLSHQMGPFELLDLTGIDVNYDVQMARYKDTGNLSDKPSPSLVERYARGQYGRKTKKGYYDYE